MPASDPFRTLGVAPDATADDVRAARRRLAKQLHPDRGGDARRMQELNAAAADALAMIDAGHTGAGESTSAPRPARGARNEARPQPSPPSPPPASSPSRPDPPDGGGRGARRGPWRVIEDVPSFVIEGLPEDAFVLLEATAPAVGQILDADSPYALDVRVDDPLRCWCRLELLPEGAATSVNLYIGNLGDVAGNPGDGSGARTAFPDIDEVRDKWIAALNAAEWPLSP